MALNKDDMTMSPYGYSIEYLVIESESVEVDITYMTTELSINEDLFTKCITGNIVIVDSLNLVSNIPIMEGDIIRGKFTRKENDQFVIEYDPDESIEFNFEIIKILKQDRIKQDKQIFALSFASTTYTDNLAKRISRAYTQIPYSDMVDDIYNRYLVGGGIQGKMKDKPISTEATEGLYNIIIPNMKPYDALTFISRRSFSGPNCNFLFYETKNSFFYRSFSSLFDQEPVAEYSISSGTNFLDDNHNPDPAALKAMYHNISSISMGGYQDITQAAGTGMLSNRLIVHDLYTKRITDWFSKGENGGNYRLQSHYNYNDEYNKLSHTEKNAKGLIHSTTNTKFAEEGCTVLTVYPDHSNQWENQEAFNPDRWVRQRRGQMSQLQFCKMTIVVPGNMTRCVGDKIAINLSSPEWKLKVQGDESASKDTRFAGHYIITALRRKFTEETYTLVMEVIRDDYANLTTNDLWNQAQEPGSFERNSVQGGRGGV